MTSSTTQEPGTTNLTPETSTTKSTTQKPTDSTSTPQEPSVDISASTTTASISTPQIDPMLDSQETETQGKSASSTHETQPSPPSPSSSSSSVPQKRPLDEPAQTPTKVARVDQRNGHATTQATTQAQSQTQTQTQNHNHNNHVAFAYNDQPSQSPQPPHPPQPPQPPHNPFLYPQSRSRANPPLDMGSVDSRVTTRQQYEGGYASIRNDRFKLEHIPTVYPTMEDYENRPKYMEMLHKYYGKYGMVKIVPPEAYRIPFRLDTEVSMRMTIRAKRVWSKRLSDAQQCYLFHGVATARYESDTMLVNCWYTTDGHDAFCCRLLCFSGFFFIFFIL